MKIALLLLLAAVVTIEAELGVCEIKEIEDEEPNVTHDPRYPEGTRAGMYCVASATGDPHITTFDRVRFDCMTGGEMVLLKSLDSVFEIQGRFTKIEQGLYDPEVYGWPSAIHGFTIRDEGVPDLQITLNEDQSTPDGSGLICNTDLYVDGVKRAIQTGTGDSNVEVTIIRHNVLMVLYPATGLKVILRIQHFHGECVYQGYFYIMCDYRLDEHFIGLLGTPNGHRSDDWMDESGNTVGVPFERWQNMYMKPAFDYCKETWCVKDYTQSLFSYENGKYFNDYVCDGYYNADLDDMINNASDEIKTMCGENIACIIDAVELGIEAGLAELAEEETEAGDACPVKKIDFSTYSVGEVITTQLEAEHGLIVITDKGYGAVVTNTPFGNGLVIPSDRSGAIKFLFTYSRHVMALELQTGKVKPVVDVMNLKNETESVEVELSAESASTVAIEIAGAQDLAVNIDASGAILSMDYFACPCTSKHLNQTVKYNDPTDDPDYVDPTVRNGGNLPPPIGSEPGNGGSFGDPHLKTWRGHLFDFHGECDLVLAHSDKFANGKGLDIHIRTEIRKNWSFISEAAVRIGTETIQMDKQGLYYLNGLKNAPMPNTISGFPITHSYSKKGRLSLDIDLGKKSHIFLREYKEFVSVHVVLGREEDFGDSVGLMGEFSTGRMLERDGTTVQADPNLYAQEWQVRDTEIKLFRSSRAPQYPQTCRLPDKASINARRRLDSGVTYEQAAKACEEFGDDESDIEGCIFDVMATGDLGMASGGSW